MNKDFLLYFKFCLSMIRVYSRVILDQFHCTLIWKFLKVLYISCNVSTVFIKKLLISNVLTDYLSRFGSTGHQRPDRPSSAKRRSPLSTGTYDSGISLGDTLRPGQGNRFMKSSRGSTLSAPTSQYKSEMPSITSPKHSPKDKQSLFSDGLHRNDRQSPTDSMSFEQKEAIIMNRKTPTKELQLVLI